jgi:uncharacterized protein
MSPRPLPALPDPRPRLVPGELRVHGWRCVACGHAIAESAPWCPVCRGELAEAAFGPGGVVWSSTVFRVPLDGRVPPWGLAYVDLDDAGPRILAHSRVPERLPVGARATIVGLSEDGDIAVDAEEER